MASHTVLKLVCTTTHDLSIHSNPLSRQAMTVCLMSPVMISTYCIYTCRHRPLLSQRFPLPLARNQNGAYNAFRLLACINWTYDLDLHRNITSLLYSLRLDLHITYEIHESFTFEKSFSKHFQTLTTVCLVWPQMTFHLHRKEDSHAKYNHPSCTFWAIFTMSHTHHHYSSCLWRE